MSLDYIGTFVFAITGASVAARSQFDFFGMLFLAFLTAVGGGTVRDLILDQAVFWTINSTYLYIIIAAAFISLFFKYFYEKATQLIFLFDTLGLGLFAIIGTQKALSLNATIETVLIMGVISGVLGGILRSVFNNETPIIFKKEIYATTAAISSGVYYLLTQQVGLKNFTASLIALAICLIVRYGSIKFNIHLPRAL